MYLLVITRPARKRPTFSVVAPSGCVVFRTHKKLLAMEKQRAYNAPPVLARAA